MKSEIVGRTGCGRCHECKHHILDGNQYKCLNQKSNAGKWKVGKNDGVEIILSNRWAYDFHDCCEVE